MKKGRSHRLVDRDPGNGLTWNNLRDSLTIAMGLVAVAAIFLVAVQTGDYNLIKEKMILLKSITRLTN